MIRAILIISPLLLHACMIGYGQEPKHSDGSDIGLTIIGTIIGKDNDNVALVKEIKSSRVRAVKREHLVLDEAYAVAKVDATYIVLVKPGQKALHYIHKDRFGPGETALAAKTLPQSIAQNDYFAEEGLERKREGDKTNIKMTAMYRDKIVKEDLSKILMQASAVPHIENGSIVGFRLLQIDEGSIYSKAGFRDDDVITSINGTELTSAAGAVALLRSLKGASNLEVDLLRGGAKEHIAVSVD